MATKHNELTRDKLNTRVWLTAKYDKEKLTLNELLPLRETVNIKLNNKSGAIIPLVILVLTVNNDDIGVYVISDKPTTRPKN